MHTHLRRSPLLALLALCSLIAPLAAALAKAPPAHSSALTQVQRLPYRVVDAEYSGALDRLVMVGESPNQLHIYDPVSDSSVSVDLPRPPRNVSVGPDGLYAAVGHDALISYIDLRAGSLSKLLDLPADSADIVLAGNGKIYVSPVRDQWTYLYTVDVASNTWATHTGVPLRADSRIQLHPDGQSIYAADRGLSPSDIEKYNIAVHPPAYLYDSPYHGDYAMCGNLWMSEDGLRIFTACGNVFRASATRSFDMTYNGSLSGIAGLGSIRHLSHSQAAGRVLALAHNSGYPQQQLDHQVAVIHYEHLLLDRIVRLPDFQVAGRSYTSRGRFVFANAAGS